LSYKKWFDDHAKKHKEIIDKLANFSDDEIIEYFDYENLKEKEPDFCPLFEKNKKCHNIEKLNCYLCGCPNLRFDSDGSICSIDSPNGKKINTHQDCSGCTIPHNKDFIKKNFSRDWKTIMKDCDING
jgi:Zn-finger protein